jgi:hypothetical protein
MEYDYHERKIVAVLNTNLETGTALNVLGHLAIAIGYHAKGHMGRDSYTDKSGVTHQGISKYPLIITRVKGGRLRKAVESARLDKRILVADFPSQMLETGHDDELAASIADSNENQIIYMGALMYGPSEAIDEITRKFSLWK